MQPDSLRALLTTGDFVELEPSDQLRIDLRYAGTNNFAHRNVYGGFNRAILHRIAAEKLKTAVLHLSSSHPGHCFVILDALRPRSIQRILWNEVVGTPGEKYFANPDVGSLHCYGFAVDLSVMDPRGRELDMGAGFDDFRPIAEPQLEEKFLAEGALTEIQIRNRRILRDAMQSAGFIQLPHEWWHFDALPKAEVRARYKIVE